jgi:hypothetical protein
MGRPTEKKQFLFLSDTLYLALLLHIPSLLLHVLRFLQQTFLAGDLSQTNVSRHQTFLLRHTQHSYKHTQAQTHRHRHTGSDTNTDTEQT